MFLTLIKKVQSAVAIHKYEDEAAFTEDFDYLNDEYLGAVSALDPQLGKHLEDNVFSDQSQGKTDT